MHAIKWYLPDRHWIDFALSHVSKTARVARTLARVEQIVVETGDVKTFIVRPNANFGGFKPGQYVPVRVEIDGVRHERHYSLTGDAEAPTLSFTVKRQPRGLVSNWLHDHLRRGDVIEIGDAAGDFVLPDALPERLLFIAGGSGITPVYSLITSALKQRTNADIVLLYYARTAADFAFAVALSDLTIGCPNFRVELIAEQGAECRTGRFSAVQLAELALDFAERETYVCGPAGLMNAVTTLWKENGLTERLHREVFSPATEDAVTAAVVPVNFRRSQRTVENNRPTLLQTAEAAGLRPANGCRMGICHTCTCTKISGVVRDKVTGAIDNTPGSRIRICVSEPLGPVTLDL